MSRRVLLASVGAACAATTVGMSLLFAQDQPKSAAPEGSAIPSSPEHAVLAHDVGVWTAQVKMWMEPGAEPQESVGREVNRMMGGLWLVSDFRGSIGGEEFQGHGIYGFDPIRKLYTGYWFDSMNPVSMPLEGSYDAASQTLTMNGEAHMPGQDEGMKVKTVSRMREDGTRHFEYFGEFPGSPELVKMMEITYKKLSDEPLPADASRKGVRKKGADKQSEPGK